MSDKREAQIFDNRRKFLIAKTASELKAWRVRHVDAEGNETAEAVYVLAGTECQCADAIKRERLSIEKLGRNELELLMRDELQQPTKETADA